VKAPNDYDCDWFSSLLAFMQMQAGVDVGEMDM